METRQTTPEHDTYKVINTKCVRLERHHDNQSFASVLSTSTGSHLPRKYLWFKGSLDRSELRKHMYRKKFL